MSPEIWAALIGGISGVISAYLTSTLTGRAATAASNRSDKRDGLYLAAQIGPTLRQYASLCLRAAHDDGYEEGRPSGDNGECEPTIRVDAFKPNEIEGVNWQSLPPKLMVDVFTFDDKRVAALDALSDWDEYFDPPEHAKFFTDRQFQYAKLGIEAIELGIRVFNETGHLSPLPGAAALREKLYTRLAEVEKELRASEQRVAEYEASRRNTDVPDQVST